MIVAVATGWIVAGIAGLIVPIFVSVVVGKAIDSKPIDGLTDELEAARRRHLEQDQARDESGGGAA